MCIEQIINKKSALKDCIFELKGNKNKKQALYNDIIEYTDIDWFLGSSIKERQRILREFIIT